MIVISFRRLILILKLSVRVLLASEHLLICYLAAMLDLVLKVQPDVQLLRTLDCEDCVAFACHDLESSLREGPLLSVLLPLFGQLLVSCNLFDALVFRQEVPWADEVCEIFRRHTVLQLESFNLWLDDGVVSDDLAHASASEATEVSVMVAELLTCLPCHGQSARGTSSGP